MQRLVTVAAWILVATAGLRLGQLPLPTTGLRGHYFDNLTHTGPPIAVTIDRSPSTETLHDGVARRWPAYSVDWTGFLVISHSDTYEFATLSDDGSQLEIDDQVVVRNLGPHGPQEARGRAALAAGIHPLRLRYEQHGGNFELALSYAIAGAELHTIPESALLLNPTPYWGYRLRRMGPAAAAAAALFLWVIAARALGRRGSQPCVPMALAIDRPAVAIAIIAGVGLVARILMMLGSSAILFADSDVFLGTVDSIRAGRYLEHDPFRTLLYPYFLHAFLYWDTEPPMDQIIVGAQHLLGILTTVFVYLAGRKAVGPRVALAGTLLLSLHTTQLFYENSILSETFFTFVLAASLLPLGGFVNAPTVRRAIITGLACGAITLTRPIGQWFVVVPLAIGAAMLPRWKDRIRIAIATAMTYGIVILPWAALNQQQFHFFGVALGRGFGLFIREFDIDREPPPDDTAYPEVREVLLRGLHTPSPATYVRDELGDRRKYSVPQKEELMYRFASESIATHRARFAVNTLKEWYRLIGHSLGDEQICTSPQGAYICTPRTQWYAREPFLNRPRHDHEPVRPWVVGYYRHLRIPIGVAFALAVFGLVAFLADKPPGLIQGVFLAGVIAYFTFLPSVGQAAQDRYRLPIDGLLFLFAAFGATRLVRHLGAGQQRKLGKHPVSR